MEQWISISHSIWTLLVFVIFIGITAWAWSGRNKEAFEEAARMPLEEDDELDNK